MKSNSAAPNQTTFFADDRFTMAISLERASITDHRPQASLENTFEVFADFTKNTAEALDVPLFTRVGNRYLYAIECKSAEEARKKVQAAVPKAVPKNDLFSVVAASAAPTFKIDGDDGELGYVAQLYHREQKLDFSPPPDAAVAGLEKKEKVLHQLILDFDFFTKKPIAVESFDTKAWLQGWSKTMTRDADSFLDLAEGR